MDIYNSMSLFSTIFIGDEEGGDTREDVIDKIAVDILDKIPTPFALNVIRKNLGINISPTTVVLLQEIERFNRLVTKMSSSLTLLRRVGISCLLARSAMYV